MGHTVHGQPTNASWSVDVTSQVDALQRWVLKHWPRHRQKVMYLVVGGWNSVFTYACFAIFYHLLSDRLAPSVILTIAFAVASVNGYLTFRYLVFGPTRHPVVEYLRYQAVYLPILGVNLVVLPLALMYTTLNAYIVQALFAVFAVVASYIGNRYFTFSKPKTSD
jgi:putative flippase GtrA